MTLSFPDTGSLAGIFVDVHGVRRGIYENPTLRTIKSDKAALGKCRRLMSSCIKVTVTYYDTTLFNLKTGYFMFSAYNSISPKYIP